MGYLLATPSENQFPVMGLSHNCKYRLIQHKTKMNIGKTPLPKLHNINVFGRSFGGATWLFAVKT